MGLVSLGGEGGSGGGGAVDEGETPRKCKAEVQQSRAVSRGRHRLPHTFLCSPFRQPTIPGLLTQNARGGTYRLPSIASRHKHRYQRIVPPCHYRASGLPASTPPAEPSAHHPARLPHLQCSNQIPYVFESPTTPPLLCSLLPLPPLPPDSLLPQPTAYLPICLSPPTALTCINFTDM